MAIDLKQLGEAFPDGIPEGMVAVQRLGHKVTLPQWSWVEVDDGQYWVMPADEAEARPDWKVVDGAAVAKAEASAPGNKTDKPGTGTTAAAESKGGEHGSS